MNKTSAACLALLFVSAASAAASTTSTTQTADNAVTIGFITDFSGLYADNDGQGGLEAIQMAIADFGGEVNGKPLR